MFWYCVCCERGVCPSWKIHSGLPLPPRRHGGCAIDKGVTEEKTHWNTPFLSLSLSIPTHLYWACVRARLCLWGHNLSDECVRFLPVLVCVFDECTLPCLFCDFPAFNQNVQSPWKVNAISFFLYASSIVGVFYKNSWKLVLDAEMTVHRRDAAYSCYTATLKYIDIKPFTNERSLKMTNMEVR